MTVSDQIIQVLNALCEKFGLIIDWTSENVFPYLETLCAKLVTWEIWTSVAWMGIMFVLSVASIIFAVKKRVFSSEFFDEYDIGAMFLWTGCVILWIGSIICISTQIFDIIKCVTFPEMYIFEYVQGVLNSGG